MKSQTMMGRRMVFAVIAVIGVVVVMATACSSSKPAASSASSSNSSATQSPSSTAAQNIDYSTKFFDPPLDLDLPSFLDNAPGDESAAFITWGSPDGSV